MSTFVLVHGAWHGGWCWRKVADRLRAEGHDVFTPTLTGLGERAHLLSREVGLTTHVDDVTALLQFEDLSDVILVGHSYAGLVITGVGARAADRIGMLVYLDAFLPERGETAFDLLPPAIGNGFRSAADNEGEGWKIPIRSPEALGVTDPDVCAWLQSRLVPHPLRTYQEGAEASAGVADLAGTFILCTGWAAVFRSQAERAAKRGWVVRELPTDHEVMATSPEVLVASLSDLARNR